jgi:hypothetical protein
MIRSTSSNGRCPSAQLNQEATNHPPTAEHSTVCNRAAESSRSVICPAHISKPSKKHPRTSPLQSAKHQVPEHGYVPMIRGTALLAAMAWNTALSATRQCPAQPSQPHQAVLVPQSCCLKLLRSAHAAYPHPADAYNTFHEQHFTTTSCSDCSTPPCSLLSLGPCRCCHHQRPPPPEQHTLCSDRSVQKIKCWQVIVQHTPLT